MISPGLAIATGGDGYRARSLSRINAVLMAINSDVHVSSYDELASGAPLLLLKVFEPLFNYPIMGINSCPSTLAAHERNCDILLNELRRNVEASELRGISGAMICDGDEDAISRVVDVLFERSEHMRHWFGEVDEFVAPPKAMLPSHRALKKDSAKKQQQQQQQQFSPLREGRSYSDQNILNSSFIGSTDLATYSDNAAAPKFIETVSSLGDIDGQRTLDHVEGGGSNEAHKSLKKKKKGKKKKRSPLKKFEHGSDSEAGTEDVGRGEEKQEEAKSNPTPAAAATTAEPTAAAEDEDRKPGNKVPKGKFTKRRPKSAPSRRLMSALLAAAHASSGGDDSAPNSPRPPDSSRRSSSPDRAPTGSPKKQKSTAEREQDSLYTYDLTSGRKILKSDLIGPTGHYESVGIVKAIDDLHADHAAPKSPKKKSAPDAPHEPTVPAWPSYTTEQSVLTYIKKNKISREGPEKPPPPPARALPAYFKMQPLDLIVSVEHCCNCEYHNMTLRHDSKHYVEEADSILRALAQSVHEANLCVRLGVFRFGADVTPKSRDSDADSRIGAFEVQISYKNQMGEVISELIHSKLHSRNWPSRSVTSKRLAAFLAKLNIERHRDRKPTDQYKLTTEDNDTAIFASGIGNWLELPIASPMWTYVDRNAGAPKPIPPTRPKSSRARALTAAWNSAEASVSVPEPKVEWIFDSKGTANESIFQVGEVVWISKIGNERHPIKCIVTQTGLRNKNKEKMLMVRPAYEDSVLTVPEKHCTEQNPESQEVGPEIPRELCALLIHCSQEKALKWSKRDASDEDLSNGGNPTFNLCRKSLFQNLRDFTVSIEKLKRQYGTYKVSDPVSLGEDLDLQLSYSEPVLDWISNTLGNSANTSELVKLALSKLPQAQVPLETVPPISALQSPESKSKGITKAPIIKPPPQVSALTSDASNNGSSDVDDLMMDKSNPKFNPDIVKSSVESFASTLMNWCDENHNEGRSEHRFEPIEKMFEESQGKAMDIVDFNQALQKFGMECSIDVASSLLATFDTDGKGALQYEKLVSFLQDKSTDRFALGALWLKIRQVLVYEEGEKRVHLLGDFEDRIFQLSEQLCDKDLSISYGLLTEPDFFVALKEFKIFPQTLTQEDIDIVKGQFLIVHENATYMNGANFCAWLQPVNVERASRRIVKSLESYISRSAKGSDPNTVISEVVEKLGPATRKVTSESFLNALRALGIAVSRAEFRAFARHFNGPTGSTLLPPQCAAILRGELNPNETKQSPRKSPIVPVAPSMTNSKEPEMIATEAPAPEPKPTISEQRDSYDDDDYDRADFEAESPKAKPTSTEAVSSKSIEAGAEVIAPDSAAPAVQSQNNDSSDSEDDDDQDEEGDIAPLPGIHYQYALLLFIHFFLHFVAAIAEHSDEEYALRVDIVEIAGAELKKPEYNKIYARIGIDSSTIKTACSKSAQNGTEKRILDVSSESNTLDITPKSRNIVVDIFDEGSGKPWNTKPGAHLLSSLLRETRAANGGSVIGVVKFTVKVHIPNNGVVSVNVSGHFIEAKSSVSRRIRKMSTQDLAQVVFEPFNFDEDSDEEADMRNRDRAAAYRRPSTLSAAFLES